MISNGVVLPAADLQKIVSVFSFFPQIEKAWVYGSRAMGNNQPYSDIDLTLKGKDLNLKSINRISLALDDLYLPYEIDLSVLDKIENKELLEHIRRVGKLVYESSH